MSEKTTMRRIGLYVGGCKACEACVSLAPECFAMDEDTGKPKLVCDTLEEGLAREVISCCPEDCIEFDE